MRVGFDARWYNESGVGTYVAELLSAFAKMKQFELVIFEDPRNPVPVGNCPCVSRVPVHSTKFSLATQFELRALCKSAQIDVFHIPYQYGAPLLLSCPLVLTVHDLIPFLFPTRSWPKQLLAVPVVKMGYRAATLRARQIIADSASTARDLERILKVSPDRITPIYLAASENAFHPNSGARETEDLHEKYGVQSPYAVVASAGCNWRTKNLETALAALALGRRSSSIKFQTVVYGPGDGIETLSERDFESELNIRRVGYVPVSDLGALFRNAQLFIMPSLYEGFGLPILEAMSCGCPVVTSNGGSLSEVAGDGAQVFDPMDVCGMSGAVASLLLSSDERELWRSRALRRAAEFSWRNAAEQTIAVYRHVAGAPGKSKVELAYRHHAQRTRD